MAICTLFVLSLATGLGCRHHAVTESGAPGDDGAVPADTEADPPATPCPAELSDTPTALFEGTVVVRPPRGIDLAEQGDGIATGTPSEDSECRAAVELMQVVVLDDDPAKPLDDYLADYLASSSRTGGVPQTERVRRRDALMIEVAFPEAGEAPAARGLIRLFRRDSKVFVVFLLAKTEDWPTQEASFADATNGLLFRPR